MKHFFIFALSLLFCSSIVCMPVADGNITLGEYEAGSKFTTASVIWFVEWNQSTIWVAVEAVGGYCNPWECYFSNQPENWRVNDYSMTDGTTISSNGYALGFMANIKISCALDTNCTFNQWISNGWTLNVAISNQITVGIYPNSTIEYSVDTKWLASTNSGSVYMQCFYSSGAEKMSIDGYLGLPLTSQTSLPVSDEMYSQVFMSPTQNSGSWDHTDSTAWSAITAPSFNATQNDFGALIQHNVTATGDCYTKNLLIMPNGTLVVSDNLIVGQSENTTTHAVHIFGNLQTLNGSFVYLYTPMTLEASHSLSVDNMWLTSDLTQNSLTFVMDANITITNSLTLDLPVQIETEGSFTYGPGACLNYAITNAELTRGPEWPTGASSGSPSVYISSFSYFTSQTLNDVSSDLYASTISLGTQATLNVQGSNGSVLYADQILADSGTLVTNIPIYINSMNVSVFNCTGSGSIRYLSNNFTYGDFVVDVYDGKSHQQIVDPSVQLDLTPGDYLIFTVTDSTSTEWLFNGHPQNPVNDTMEVTSSGVLSITRTNTETGCPQEKTITVKVQSKNTKKSNSGMPEWAIAVIAIICLLLVGGIIAAILITRRRRNQRNKDNEEGVKPADKIVMQPLQPASNTYTSVAPQREQRNLAKGRDWEINYDEIKIGSELGRGAFGIVHKCKWRNTDCVVKQLDLNQSDNRAIKAFLKEADNVKNMRPHPNVCTVFGVCTNPKNPICIVMEFVSEGSLDNLLYTNKINVTTELLLQFAKDIASGMSHLHAENILHCDLACRNVLVTMVGTKYVLKIADFGLSKIIDKSEYTRSNKTFPIRWTAPEALRSGTISRGSDVWSYGVVLWEIMEAKRPYPELSNEDVIKAVCDEGKRLGKPNNMPEEIYQLMTRCWKTNPGERPSFNEICEELEKLEGSIVPKNKNTKSEFYANPEPTKTGHNQYTVDYNTHN